MSWPSAPRAPRAPRAARARYSMSRAFRSSTVSSCDPPPALSTITEPLQSLSPSHRQRLTFAAGAWRGLHSVFRAVLAAHGFTLDPETRAIEKLAPTSGRSASASPGCTATATATKPSRGASIPASSQEGCQIPADPRRHPPLLAHRPRPLAHRTDQPLVRFAADGGRNRSRVRRKSARLRAQSIIANASAQIRAICPSQPSTAVHAGSASPTTADPAPPG